MGRSIDRLPLLCLVAALALISGSGCVTKGIHDATVVERDQLALDKRRLEKKNRRLEASTKSLGAELNRTLEQYEDLSVEHRQLVEEVAALRNTEAHLASKLTDQSVELVRSQEQLAVARSELERLTSTYTTLMSDLESEVSSGQIQIEQLREGIRVNVSDDILFASGQAELDPVGQKVLEKVAAQLVELEHDIEVQGHTDDRPIRGGLARRFPTNWDLAAARAARVTRLLETAGIDGDRLSVVSFASHRPVAPNDTPQDRALNRRIEIRLKPKGAPVTGPAGPPQKAVAADQAAP